MAPLISVIVITYNASDTIQETLNSIVDQTYENLEIIVSDDCSSDATVQIVQDWTEKFGVKRKIKIIEAEKNTGIAGNCNRGVKAADGEYVKLLAGDDCLMPEAIEFFYNALKDDSDAMFQSKVVLIDGDGNELSSSASIENYVENNYKILSNKKVDQYKRLLRSNFLIAPAMGLIDKSFFTKYGYFDEDISMMEDYPFYLNLSSNGIKFKLIDSPLVKYRIYGRSVSSSGSVRYERSKNKFYYKVRRRELLKNFMWITAVKEWLKCIYRKIKYKL